MSNSLPPPQQNNQGQAKTPNWFQRLELDWVDYVNAVLIWTFIAVFFYRFVDVETKRNVGIDGSGIAYWITFGAVVTGFSVFVSGAIWFITQERLYRSKYRIAPKFVVLGVLLLLNVITLLPNASILDVPPTPTSDSSTIQQSETRTSIPTSTPTLTPIPTPTSVVLEFDMPRSYTPNVVFPGYSDLRTTYFFSPYMVCTAANEETYEDILGQNHAEDYVYQIRSLNTDQAHTSVRVIGWANDKSSLYLIETWSAYPMFTFEVIDGGARQRPNNQRCYFWLLHENSTRTLLIGELARLRSETLAEYSCADAVVSVRGLGIVTEGETINLCP